jgi:hypothetical protein
MKQIIYRIYIGMSSNTTPSRNSITHRTDGTTHEFRWMGIVLVIEEWDSGTLYIEGFRNRSTVKGRGRKILCFVLEGHHYIAHLKHNHLLSEKS